MENENEISSLRNRARVRTANAYLLGNAEPHCLVHVELNGPDFAFNAILHAQGAIFLHTVRLINILVNKSVVNHYNFDSPP